MHLRKMPFPPNNFFNIHTKGLVVVFSNIVSSNNLSIVLVFHRHHLLHSSTLPTLNETGCILGWYTSVNLDLIYHSPVLDHLFPGSCIFLFLGLLAHFVLVHLSVTSKKRSWKFYFQDVALVKNVFHLPYFDYMLAGYRILSYNHFASKY